MALLNTPPNTRRSKITDLTIHNASTSASEKGPVPPTAYPSISHSTIEESTFTNLTSNSKISHSTLKHVDLALTPDSHPKDTKIRHSCIISSALTNIASANHLKASDSSLSDLGSVSRVSVRNSSIAGDNSTTPLATTSNTTAKCGNGRTNNCNYGTQIKRAEITDSSITATEMWRCKLDSVRVGRSKLRRVALRQCDVDNCVLARTEFTGMRLRNGIWRNGKLVGPVDGMGKRDVVADSLVSFFSFCSFLLVWGLIGIWKLIYLYRPVVLLRKWTMSPFHHMSPSRKRKKLLSMRFGGGIVGRVGMRARVVRIETLWMDRPLTHLD